MDKMTTFEEILKASEVDSLREDMETLILEMIKTDYERHPELFKELSFNERYTLLRKQLQKAGFSKEELIGYDERVKPFFGGQNA